MVAEQHQLIPIKKGWPLLGILPKLFVGDPFEYLKNIMLEQGDLVQINFANQPVYLVSNPDYLQRILRDNYQNYRKPDMLYNVTREVAGNGLVTSSGDFWLRQRRMIQPHLHRKQLGYLFSEMIDAISEALERWTLLAENGTVIELGEKMGEITMDITMRTMFGKNILPEAEVAEIGACVIRIIKYVGETLYSSMVPKWFPIPGRQQFLRDLNTMKETINQIITKCRKEKETSASLIQMLINAVDEESHQQMTEQQLFDEVMTIFIAGYETTTTALTWLGVVIQKHPEVLMKLQAEADQVLGKHAPSFEDAARLTYTRQVFMEILRMYTVIPFLPRALNEPDQLGNHYLPANALLLVFLHGIHHNPHVWDNPEAFDPERFTPERMVDQSPFAYMPFSAGPRKCAGDELALLEGPLAMAMILQKYHLNIVPDQTFTPRLSGTMRPGKGVKATFSIKTP